MDYGAEFHLRNPVHLPITPGSVIQDWTTDNSLNTGGYNAEGWDTFDFFLDMVARNYIYPPDYVLALANGTEVHDIMAIANGFARDEGAGGGTTIDIGQLVVKPALVGSGGGVAPAFLRKIMEWASMKSRVAFLPRPDKLDAYYRSLGVNLVDDVVSEESLSRDGPQHSQKLYLVTLESGVPPRPGVAAV